MRTMTTTAAIAAAGLLLAACGSGDADVDPTASASASAQPSATSSILIWSDPAHADGPRGQRAGPPGGDGGRGPGPDRRARTSPKIRDDITDPGSAGPGSRPLRRAERLGRPARRLRPAGSRRPLDPQRAASVPWRSNGFTYQARTYGVPFATENLALFRNTELAPEVPESIDVMARDGLELTDKDDQILPIALPGRAPGRRVPLVPVLQRGRRQDLRPRRAGWLHRRRAGGRQARQHRGCHVVSRS